MTIDRNISLRDFLWQVLKAMENERDPAFKRPRKALGTCLRILTDDPSKLYPGERANYEKMIQASLEGLVGLFVLSFGPVLPEQPNRNILLCRLSGLSTEKRN